MCILPKIKSIFYRKPPEPQFERVEFSHLLDFLREKHREDIGDISRETEKFKTKVMDGFNDLRELNSSLNNIKAFDVLSRASVEVKNNFCEKVSSILSRLPDRGLPADEFIEKSEKIIEDINRLTPRQAAHIGFFFKEHVNNMASKMKSITSAIEDFREFVTTSMLTDIEEIEKHISDIRESERKIDYIEKNIGEIGNETEDMKTKEQKHASKIPQIDRNKMLSLKETMAELNRQKQSIEQEIDTDFGSITKLLKKYEHDTKDRKKKSLAEKYVSSASWAFLIHDKELSIKKILSEVKADIEAKRIESDEKHYVHVCSLLSNMVQLKKTKEKYSGIMEKICEKESELAKEEKISDKVGRMHDELKDVRSRIVERGSMKKQLEDSKSKVMESIEQKLKEIEFIISSDLGINVKINYSLPGSSSGKAIKERD